MEKAEIITVIASHSTEWCGIPKKEGDCRVAWLFKPLLLAMTFVLWGIFMYLSIGNDMAVRDKSIIGIFDLDNTSTSKRTREFLDAAEKEGEVVPCDDLPKSFVLTSEYGFNRVHLTSLNSTTLEKRLK